MATSNSNYNNSYPNPDGGIGAPPTTTGNAPPGANPINQNQLMHNGILDMPGPGGNTYYNNNNRRYNNNYNNNFNNNFNNNAFNNRVNSYNNSGYSSQPTSSYYQDWSKPMPADEALEKYVNYL